MDKDLLEKIIGQVSDDIDKEKTSENKGTSGNTKMQDIGVTEYVGVTEGDTIGLVIAGVDQSLAKKMNLGKYRSLGIIGSRTGAGPQIMAVDDAVKATNTEVLTIEMPRDTKGGGGHGILIYIGAEDVSDARRAVEIALETTPKYFGDVYGNEAGHLEFQYTARASYCLEKAFNTPLGKSFGMVIGSPAAIGTVLADTAVKAANVEIVGYSSPGNGTSFSNEVILCFTGDSGAVRQAVKTSIELGIKLLGTLGDTPSSTTTPYI